MCENTFEIYLGIYGEGKYGAETCMARGVIQVYTWGARVGTTAQHPKFEPKIIINTNNTNYISKLNS